MRLKNEPTAVDDVGARIKTRREALGLTQRELGDIGASFTYVSRIEAGTRSPTIEALMIIAAKLDTTALYLLTGDEQTRCPCCGRG